MLLLQILGAIALIVVVALLVGLWWVRRWWKRAVQQSGRVLRDVDPVLNWPARLLLEGSAIDPNDDPLALHWPVWVNAGFTRLGDYRSADGELTAVRLASHPSGAALCLALDPLQQPCAIVYAVTGDGRLLAISNGPGHSASTPKLQWTISNAIDPAAMLAALDEHAASINQTLRPLDARVAVAAIERGYAVWMDQQLTRPPTPESVQARRSTTEAPLEPTELAASLALHRSRWREQLSAAALDHWRQSTKPDAQAWNRLEGEIQVIPEAISDDEVQELLGGDDLADQLLAQTAAQGLSGIRRYAAVVERLGVDQARHELGRLNRPVALRLYLRNAAQPAEHASAEVRTYVYRRADGDDSGSVLATSVADARNQLRSLGLADAEILIEPNAMSASTDRLLWSPDAAAIAARAAQESVGRALLRSLIGNLWLWLPPLLLLAWTFRGESEFGLWQGVAVGYAVLSLGALLWLVLPMVLYNQVLACKASARLASAKNLMTVLRLIRPLGMTAAQIQRELASIEFAMGLSDKAHARLQALRPAMDEAGWYETLAATLGSSADHDALIDAQRRAMDLAQDPTLLKIDLAMSLLRYRRDASGAEALLRDVAPGSLSATATAGYHYARGLLLAERDQHSPALRQYRSAVDSLAAFKSNPLIGTLTAEIEAFAALSLRADGRDQEAEALWASVWPLLSRHQSTRYLEQRWTGA